MQTSTREVCTCVVARANTGPHSRCHRDQNNCQLNLSSCAETGAYVKSGSCVVTRSIAHSDICACSQGHQQIYEAASTPVQAAAARLEQQFRSGTCAGTGSTAGLGSCTEARNAASLCKPRDKKQARNVNATTKCQREESCSSTVFRF